MVLSFLTLPLPVFLFSKINCNYTSIYERSNYNLKFINYSSFLNKATYYNNYVLDNDEIDNDKIDNEPYLERYYVFLKDRKNFPFIIFIHKFFRICTFYN